MSWQILLLLPGDSEPTDVYGHTTGEMVRRQHMHSDLSSVINTAQFTLTSESIANEINAASEDIDCQIVKGGSTWFRGIIRANVVSTVRRGFDGIVVEVTDYLIRLRSMFGSSVALAFYSISNPADTGSSLMYRLLTDAGVPSDLCDSLPTVDITIPWFVAEANQDEYYVVIDELLYHHGYVMDTLADGSVTLRDVYPTSYTPTAITNADTYDELVIERRERMVNAVRVEWSPVITLSGYEVFSDTTGGTGGNKMSVELAANEYYPEESGTRTTYAEFRVDDGDLLLVHTAQLHVETAAGSVTTNTFDPGLTRAHVQLQAGGAGATLSRFDITGTAIIRDRATRNVSLRRESVEDRRVREVDAKWIATQAQADRLANGLYRYNRFNAYLYTWRDPNASRSIGELLDLSESTLGITQDLRVIEVEEDAFGEQTVVAEAMSAYAVVAGDSELGYSPPRENPERTAERVTNDNPTYEEIVDGFTAAGGTTVPTQATATAISADAGVALSVDRQLNLTNLDRYEWQVSDDGGTTQYALAFGGTGLGTEGQNTNWSTVFLVHAPLPLDGTDADPAQSQWWYRVRRVTKEPVFGAWSDWVSAYALPVGSGRIAADSIYGNQIRAGEVTAELMAAENFVFTKSVGSASRDTPQSGDVRSYLGKDPAGAQSATDPVGLSIEEYNGENWETRLKGAMRAGGNVADLFVSGFFQAGESVLSSPGLIWKESSQSFSTASDNRVNDIAANGSTAIAVSQRGEVARSTDYGKTFGSPISNSHSGSAINGVALDGSDNGIMVGDGGKASYSSNDGQTWGSLLTTGYATDLNAVATDGNGLWVAAQNTNAVIYSTNNGTSWTVAPLIGFGNVVSLEFCNDRFLIGSSIGGDIAHSTDGANWTIVSLGVGSTIVTGVGFASNNYFAGTSDGDILYSTDDCATWTAATMPATTFNAYSFATIEGVIIAAGSVGVLRSTNGGRDWGTRSYQAGDISMVTLGTGLLRGAAAATEDGSFLVSGYNVESVSPFTEYPVIASSNWLEAGAGIVEQGSNSNGNYVVFSSGLQVCWHRFTMNANEIRDFNIGTYGWSFYITPSGERVLTLPKAFANDDYACGASSATVSARADPVSTTSVNVYIASPTNSTALNVSYWVIGQSA